MFTLPDYGDATALYQCHNCGDIIAVSPDAEHYLGPPWDTRRSNDTCPACNQNLEAALAYPDHFRCPECGEIGQFADIPTRYPPDEESVLIHAWNPYA
jgi:predicted RNA-binding Zn-ribbon protein involved in translation (DUF1610 family)